MNKKSIVFVWHNYGPLHVDRCQAVVKQLGHDYRVVGLEISNKSKTYSWRTEDSQLFEKITLSPAGYEKKGLALLTALIKQRIAIGRSSWFLCHYERLEILFFALLLRVLGDRVITMGCSKFDDYPRRAPREFFKSLYYLPYHAAIGSGKRSKEYYRFLGFSEGNVHGEYNCVSHERIRELSGIIGLPDGLEFKDRHFTIVARLVPKKNLFMAIKAYDIYLKSSGFVRKLMILGDGPLEEELRDYAKSLKCDHMVEFKGFVQTETVAKHLARSLALILCSKEEQFGNVVAEALALNLPVIISDNCGARDNLVKSGLNGFVVEPDNFAGLAYYMNLLSSDESLWLQMIDHNKKMAHLSDSPAFADGVKRSIHGRPLCQGSCPAL